MILAAMVLASPPAHAAPVGGPGYFPNVPLTTQDGKVVRFYDDLLKGKAVIINMMYTSCGFSCPLETAKLTQVQRLLGDRVGKDIFIYSLTLDPGHDRPAVLKAYAKKFGAKPGWLFLTGNKKDLQLINKRLGLASLTDGSNPDGHMPTLLIGKESTNEWMRNSAIDNPQFLATTILHFFGGYGAAQPPSYAKAATARIDRSAYLFNSRCAACHTIGKGDRVGPDLLNVTAKRDPAWLTRYIAAPDRVLASGDPIATKLFARYKRVAMPNLSLGPDDVKTLLSYIEQQSRATPAACAHAAAR
jgi:protein SCO1/2